MSGKPACLLHIGTEKTGSTALQWFLQENSVKLMEQGYFVPKPSVHHALYQGGWAAWTELVLPALERAKHDALCVILSNENLYLLNEAKVTLLRSRLLKTFAESEDDLKIIVYLRPQHELAISSYSTALRTGELDPEILPKIGIRLPKYDYLAMLERWTASGYLRDNIQVRSYVAVTDICSDFLRGFGIDTTEFEHPRRINQSLAAEVQWFLNETNRAALKLRERWSADMQTLLVEQVEKFGNRPGLLPSRSQVALFNATYEEGNHKLSDFWLNGSEIIGSDLSAYPEQEQGFEGSSEIAFDLFINAWAFLVEAVSRQAADITQLVRGNIELESHAVRLDEALKDTEVHTNHLTRALETRAQQVADLGEAHGSLIGRVRALDEAYTTAARQIQDYDNAFQEAERNARLASEALAFRAQQISDLQRAQQSAVSRIEELQAASTAVAFQIKNYDDAFKQAEKNAKALSDALDIRARQVADLQDINRALVSRIRALQATSPTAVSQRDDSDSDNNSPASNAR